MNLLQTLITAEIDALQQTTRQRELLKRRTLRQHQFLKIFAGDPDPLELGITAEIYTVRRPGALDAK